MSRNVAWYSLNQQRCYPFDELASLVDDAGVSIPTNIISDLHICFPRSLARYAYVSGITVGASVVSAVILGVDSLTAPSTPVPLAAIRILRPFMQDKQYALTPLAAGVGGWIVFGDNITESGLRTWRCSSVGQAQLLPRIAKAYRDLPIQSFGKLGVSTALTGIVKLIGGDDIEIVRECVEIPGHVPVASDLCDSESPATREAIVIRLKNTDNSQQRNVFDIYKGPCGDRPESNTCGDPIPVEAIGTVTPDCSGNITIEFTGCGVITDVHREAFLDNDGELVSTEDVCGVIVDCGLGLGDMCVTAARLPTDDGTLPNEYEDLCVSISDESITIIDEEELDPFVIDSEVEETEEDPALPLVDNLSSLVGWTTLLGGYSVVSGTIQATQLSVRNLAYRNLPLDTAYYRKVVVDMRLTNDINNTLNNGSVVFGIQSVDDDYRWIQVTMDWDGFYVGTRGLVLMVRSQGQLSVLNFTALPAMALDTLYRVVVACYPSEDPNYSWVVAYVRNAGTGALLCSVDPTAVAWDGSLSRFGVESYKATTIFDRFVFTNSGDLVYT